LFLKQSKGLVLRIQTKQKAVLQFLQKDFLFFYIDDEALLLLLRNIFFQQAKCKYLIGVDKLLIQTNISPDVTGLNFVMVMGYLG
jgi:hypothetical protein